MAWDHIAQSQFLVRNSFVQAVYESYLSLVVGLLAMWYWHFCQMRQNDLIYRITLVLINAINPLLLHITGWSLLDFMFQGLQVIPSLFFIMVNHFPLKIKIMTHQRTSTVPIFLTEPGGSVTVRTILTSMAFTFTTVIRLSVMVSSGTTGRPWGYYSLKRAEMKIRPVDFWYNLSVLFFALGQ